MAAGQPEQYSAPDGEGNAELIEKRSRFIAHVAVVESEEEAKEVIARVRAKYHDARHNCWCYCILNGPERYSDDGEPQGTAGLPMLEVFKRGGILNVCCVVTRYFGGILLGTGGLSRAYSEAAKLAFNDAGICVHRLYDCIKIVCGYSFLGKAKLEIEGVSGIIENTDYGENVTFNVLLPAGKLDALNKRLGEASAGAVSGIVTGKQYVKKKAGQ